MIEGISVCTRGRASVDGCHDRNARGFALNLDVGGVEHLKRGQVDVTRHANARFACIDSAKRRDEVDIARFHFGDRVQCADTGPGRRHLRREPNIAVIVVDAPGRRVEDRRLGTPARIDVAFLRPAEDVAPEGRQYARKSQQQ